MEILFLKEFVLVQQKDVVMILSILDTNRYDYCTDQYLGEEIAKHTQTTYSKEWGGYNWPITITVSAQV